MTLYSDLYLERRLISRRFYVVPATLQVIAPPNGQIARVSMVGGGGGAGAPGWGCGAAFARSKFVCLPGEDFTVQIGEKSLNAAGGDSIFTRNTGAVVLVKAERGKPTEPGLAVNCVGDVKRDGFIGQTLGAQKFGGASAGDDADPFPLGFGGRGARSASAGQQYTSAYPGGGGVAFLAYASGGYQVPWTIPAAVGRVCVEFFDQDPGY